VQARQLKQRGLLFSGALLASGLGGLLASTALGLPLHHLPQFLDRQLENAAVVLLGTIVAVLAAVGVKKRAEDTLAVEWHNGRWYLQLEVPPRGGPTVPRDALEVAR